jgi:hypothetical protein
LLLCWLLVASARCLFKSETFSWSRANLTLWSDSASWVWRRKRILF